MKNSDVNVVRLVRRMLIVLMVLAGVADGAFAAGFSVRPLDAMCYRGEPVRFGLRCSQPSYVFILQIADGNASTLVFPGDDMQSNIFPSDKEFTVSVPQGKSGVFKIICVQAGIVAGLPDTAAQLQAVRDRIDRKATTGIDVIEQIVPVASGIRPAAEPVVVKPAPPRPNPPARPTPVLNTPAVAKLALELRAKSIGRNEQTSCSFRVRNKGYAALYLVLPDGSVRFLGERQVLPGVRYVKEFAVSKSGACRLHLAWAAQEIQLPLSTLEALQRARNIVTTTLTVR